MGLVALSMLIATVCGAGTQAIEIIQTNHFDTGYDGTGTPLLIPSIDPAGISYHAPSGHLFIADSEINELPTVFAEVGGNIFEVSMTGDTLFRIYDTTTEGNNEPTGITYNEFDGFFYMSNDDTRKVYRYSYSDTEGFTMDAEVSTLNTASAGDPEGLTSDPANGLIYVVDGVGKLLVVYSFDEAATIPAFVLEHVYDLVALNDIANVPSDPEGVCFDVDSGNLWISSDPNNAIYEYSITGIYQSRQGLGSLSPVTVAPQGLCYAPVSPASGSLAEMAIYIADGMVDNDENGAERDGQIYETILIEEGTTNLAPVLAVIGDQFVDEGSLLTFTASAVDPDVPADDLIFSLGGSVPTGASIDPVTGVFTWTPTEEQGPLDFNLVVRVDDNGIPSLSDEETIHITVNELNQPPVLDLVGNQVVVGGTELSFTATANDPDVAPGLWEDLVSYWSFDTDFSDFSGGHNGTGVGDATIITTGMKLGAGALYLDGVGDYLNVNDIPLTGDMSISIWILPEAIQSSTAGGANGVLLGDTANLDWLRLQLEGVTAKWDGTTAYQTTDPDFTNGNWQHFMLVRTGSTVTVYRDNVVVTSFTQTAPFTPELIGCKTSGGNYYQGTMDDLALWNRALSGLERDLVFNGGDGMPVGDTEGIPVNTLTFSLEGTVPGGASINPATGVFSWYPNQSQTPGEYTFTVRVIDDGVPSYFDEETITVTVEDGGPIPPMIVAIDDKVTDEEDILSFIVNLVGSSGPDISDGLVAYWPFNSDFSDLSGGYDGTAVGDAGIITTGMKLGGGALYLDGVGDYLNVTDIPLSGDMSISLWIFPEAIQSGSAGEANGVLLGDTANLDWLRLQIEGVTAKWDGTTAYYATDPDFTNGSWQHFVLTRSGSLVTVYRNNVAVASFTHTHPFTPELIGCKTSGSNYYQGTMDDLAIWGRALSTEEIGLLYNDGDGTEVLASTNNSVAFSLEGTPPSGASINPISGLFIWTPDESQGPDQYLITVKATDLVSPELFDTEEFGVTVNEVNKAPVIEAIADLAANEEELLSVMVLAADPDIPSNSISYSLGEGSITGMAIDSMSGMFTWTPSETQGPGIYPVLIKVMDDGVPSLVSEESFIVTVTEVNTAPVLEPIGDQVAVMDTELTFTAVANDNDQLLGLTDGLVAHWAFDADYTSSTGQHDGVPMSGANITTTPGEFVLGGGALHFDGVDDYLDFGDTPLALDLTLSAWVYPTNIDALTTSSAIIFGDGDNLDWIRLETDGVRTKWDNVTTEMTSEPDFVNGNWQLFTLVRSGTTVSVYRNGVLVTSATTTEKFTPEYLGLKTPNTNYYGGFMDDVAIWGRALSLEEISSLYNGGTGNPIGGALPNPANTLAFSLEGTVPAGAGIDAVTGVFSWTPSAGQAPGEYPLTVRVTDDGTPPLSDEETLLVTVTGDGVAPGPVTDLNSEPGHEIVTVSWTPSGDTDLATFHVYRGLWHDGDNLTVYPEYDDVAGNTTPGRPADLAAAESSAEWALAGTVPATQNSFTDDPGSGVLPRGVYYYEVFAEDTGGNFSLPSVASTRATNYWLGDINEDGLVNVGGDINSLSLTYGLSGGEEGFSPFCDVGPTDDWSGTGIPLTDIHIDFEDLMIFSVNWDVGETKILPTEGSMIARFSWEWVDESTWSLVLTEPCANLKGVNLQAELPRNAVLSLTAGSLLGQQESPYFLGNGSRTGLDAGLALLGNGAGITGRGELIRVKLTGEFDFGDLMIEVRDSDNKDLEYTLEVKAAGPGIPTMYSLSANYPNPFNPSTKIDFDLPESQNVKLVIFGVDGRRVTTLRNESMPAGRHSVTWTGRNDQGELVATGIYFYRIEAGSFSETKKMILIK
ncbi:MAG: putative Ig domain-containing protein [Candidatus Krumholzibacteria bacterium]|nr:putative Ig domain-containing protein [Candidatus Krumholzibacteria bacterium]